MIFFDALLVGGKSRSVNKMKCLLDDFKGFLWACFPFLRVIFRHISRVS